MRALGLKKSSDKNKSAEIAVEKKKADVVKRQKNVCISILSIFAIVYRLLIVFKGWNRFTK